eukprot:snap_masked-scaffold_3-processed-gene-5.37-mRNA-1 protein AED:1.00 eAED:1.00 QI:0/-1/0/0/-1/1/1/0/437
MNEKRKQTIHSWLVTLLHLNIFRDVLLIIDEEFLYFFDFQKASVIYRVEISCVKELQKGVLNEGKSEIAVGKIKLVPNSSLNDISMIPFMNFHFDEFCLCLFSHPDAVNLSRPGLKTLKLISKLNYQSNISVSLSTFALLDQDICGSPEETMSYAKLLSSKNIGQARLQFEENIVVNLGHADIIFSKIHESSLSKSASNKSYPIKKELCLVCGVDCTSSGEALVYFDTEEMIYLKSGSQDLTLFQYLLAVLFARSAAQKVDLKSVAAEAEVPSANEVNQRGTYEESYTSNVIPEQHSSLLKNSSTHTSSKEYEKESKASQSPRSTIFETDVVGPSKMECSFLKSDYENKDQVQYPIVSNDISRNLSQNKYSQPKKTGFRNFTRVNDQRATSKVLKPRKQDRPHKFKGESSFMFEEDKIQFLRENEKAKAKCTACAIA